MSKILFDCSQFITLISRTKEPNIEEIKSIYSNKSFDVKVNTEINHQKLSYFSNEFLEVTIEIVDKEFLGNFEDWKVETDVPLRIREFAEATNEMVNLLDVNEYKIIFVEYASSTSSQDSIARRTLESEDLIEELFYASRYNFELFGNVYIFTTEQVI